MKAALDTNVLVYFEGINSGERRNAAISLVQELQPKDAAMVPVQALGELYTVLVRKAGWSPTRAQTAILAWRDALPLLPTTDSAMLAAVALAGDHALHIWDGVMIAVAAENGCRLLLSEDMQDGFSWRGLTVVNPFAARRHPLLEALLEPAADKGEEAC